MSPSRIRSAKRNVLAHRRAEQKCLLRHKADRPAQVARSQIAQVNPIQENGALNRIHEPRNQVH